MAQTAIVRRLPDPFPTSDGDPPRPPERLPDPSEIRVRTLALCAVEIIKGLRPLEQLGGWATREVLSSLGLQRTLRTERQAVYREHRRMSAAPGRVIVSRINDRVAECVVIMHAGHRSFSVCARLEVLRGSWKASQLYVL